ncbi:uncharacterized protein LOC119731533 [Patiria miniata]|uniref:Replication protein A OB domain-containing protein n=1 Tax=Patiria miniata TaxID=46514 RepID=A0A914AB98_PATMI|nr:uncharacterized protein LOC119731533 [Patiria miniata]
MTSVSFKILGDFEKRGQSWCADVVVKDTDSIRALYTSIAAHLDLMHNGQFIKATKANMMTLETGQDIVRLTGSSKIYRSGAFDIDDAVLGAYFNAPVVGVAEVCNKPEFERCSVKGTIVDVSPIKTTAASKRKEIQLQDLDNKAKKICIKLWSESADQCIPVEQSAVIVKNVCKRTYNNADYLNSTQQTTVEPLVPSSNTVSITLEGFAEDSDDMLNLVTDHDAEYSVAKHVLLTGLGYASLDELQNYLPMVMNINYCELSKKVKEVGSIVLDGDD